MYEKQDYERTAADGGAAERLGECRLFDFAQERDLLRELCRLEARDLLRGVDVASPDGCGLGWPEGTRLAAGAPDGALLASGLSNTMLCASAGSASASVDCAARC